MHVPFTHDEIIRRWRDVERPSQMLAVFIAPRQELRDWRIVRLIRPLGCDDINHATLPHARAGRRSSVRGASMSGGPSVGRAAALGRGGSACTATEERSAAFVAAERGPAKARRHRRRWSGCWAVAHQM